MIATSNTIVNKTTIKKIPRHQYLSDSTQTPGLHLLGVQLHGALGEVESLLDDAGELPDSATLLSEDILGPGGHDDDLSPGGGHTDLKR